MGLTFGEFSCKYLCIKTLKYVIILIIIDKNANFLLCFKIYVKSSSYLSSLLILDTFTFFGKILMLSMKFGP